MTSRVIKPFPYAGDGHTVVGLIVGDERDFGGATDGLTAEGFIEPAGDGGEVSEPAALSDEPAATPEPKAEPSATAADTPAEDEKPSKRK